MTTLSSTVGTPSPRSHVHDAYTRVREAILDGRLPAGTITTQVALAQTLGLGRTPLREALRLLQREGLVESRHHRRLRIAPFSLEDLEGLYAMRIVNEALGLRLTVPCLSGDELDSLDRTLDEMERLAEDSASWERVHRTFHHKLSAHAGGRLAALNLELLDHAERYRRFYLDLDATAWNRGAADHHAIVTACREGDVSGSARRLAEHLARTALGVAAMVDPAHDPVQIREALGAVA